MKKISVAVIAIAAIVFSCHKGPQYPNTQTQFAEDPSFRLGKWYSVTDSGTTVLSNNTNLDTIWFINDTLAGWTDCGGNPYAFFKTYVSPQSIYNLVVIAIDRNTGQPDTSMRQFGFTPTGDTLGIYWNLGFGTFALEQYVKMK